MIFYYITTLALYRFLSFWSFVQVEEETFTSKRSLESNINYAHDLKPSAAAKHEGMLEKEKSDGSKKNPKTCPMGK